jgi:hypothetical protein
MMTNDYIATELRARELLFIMMLWSSIRTYSLAKPGTYSTTMRVIWLWF